MKKNNKTQIVILGCLIAVILAFGAYRIIGMGTQAAPPEEQTVKKGVADVSDETPAADEPVLIAYADESRARDPFAPQVGAKTESSQSSQTGSGQSPVIDVGPILPFPFGEGSSPIQFSPVAPEERELTPDLRLTGVIEGDMNVAIIRSGDNRRFIVREGQMIDGMYTVESIARAGVRLKHNGKSFVLKLGRREAS